MTHVIVLPGGGYAEHVAHEAEPIAGWLGEIGARASVFRYPLLVRHPEPLNALRAEIRRLRESGVERIGLVGFSAGGHLAGLAAVAPGTEPVDFVVLGYAITSMEAETYRPARQILLGDNATPELRRATSLDALVAPSSPPFFLWHTAEDPYVQPEHTYRLATALAANAVAHSVHVSAHGPHPTAWASRERPATPPRGRRLRRHGSLNRAAPDPPSPQGAAPKDHHAECRAAAHSLRGRARNRSWRRSHPQHTRGHH